MPIVGLAVRLGQRPAPVPLVRPVRDAEAGRAGRIACATCRTTCTNGLSGCWWRWSPLHAGAAFYHHFFQRDATLVAHAAATFIATADNDPTPACHGTRGTSPCRIQDSQPHFPAAVAAALVALMAAAPASPPTTCRPPARRWCSPPSTTAKCSPAVSPASRPRSVSIRRNLATSKLDVTIPLAGAKTGNDDRDSTLSRRRFLQRRQVRAGALHAPRKFRSLGGNQYAADGTLDLRGVSKPVTLTFTWTPGAHAGAVGQGHGEAPGFRRRRRRLGRHRHDSRTKSRSAPRSC